MKYGLHVLALAWISLPSAAAGLITFDNESDFLNVAGAVTVESFEGATGTGIHSLVTPNFEIEHTSVHGFSVLTSSTAGAFATDGTHFLEEISSDNEMRFHQFAGPLRSFGLFITDFGDFGTPGPLTATINGTTTFTLAEWVGPPADGSLIYFGVVATGTDSITEVKLASGDAIGIDEVSFASVPEPTSCCFMALVGLLFVTARRRRCATTTIASI